MKSVALFICVSFACISGVACRPPAESEAPVAADPPAENQQQNVCTPPNHPAFRKYGVYRNSTNGLWYTHTIDLCEATVVYKSNPTCTCQMWNPVNLSQCMINVPTQRQPHANDYSSCAMGCGHTCRYYIGTDANHSGYVLVGPQDGL